MSHRSYLNSIITNLHCTIIEIPLLVSLPTLLLAEHVCPPASILDTFIIVNLSVTLGISPFPVVLVVVILTLSLINRLLLNVHAIVGNGIPVASHVIVTLVPSTMVLSVSMMLVTFGWTAKRSVL